MPSKNGNQNPVHVGSANYIFKTWDACSFIKETFYAFFLIVYNRNITLL